MRLRPALERRLGQVRAEVLGLREELRVLEEQASFQSGVADEVAGQAVAAGTPLADRERQVAQDDARRVQRERDETAERLRSLLDEQDLLLERLLERQGGTT